MLTHIITEPGSMREENQDVTLAREDAGVFILADGGGAYGREAAGEIAGTLAEASAKIRRQASVEATSERLGQAIRESYDRLRDWNVNRPGYQTVTVNLAVALIVEGNLFLGVVNTCGLLGQIGGQPLTLAPVGLRMIPADPPGEATGRAPEPLAVPAVTLAGPFPLAVGDWIMLFSEGLLMSQPLEELECLIPSVHQEADEITSGIFRRATARYDGDDRTLALLRVLPADLERLLADEVVISTEIDKTTTVPVWAALLVMVAGVLLSLVLQKLNIFSDEDP